MEFSDVVRGRRSIRKYQDRPVPDAEIERLIELAVRAPSSMNGQPWHFIVVKDGRTKSALAAIKNRHCPPEKRAFLADFLIAAPVILVICVDVAQSFGREIENSVLASDHIMLAAADRGLGTVYMSAYAEGAPGLAEEIKKELAIPDGVEPVSMLPLGYPDEVPEPNPVRSLRDIIHRERF